MNVKKETMQRIEKMVYDEMLKCRRLIQDNKYKMKQYVKEQTILKRELANLNLMLQDIKAK